MGKLDKIFTIGDWKVFYRKDRKDTWSMFVGKKGYWYADPLQFKYQGKTFLFMEAFEKCCQIGRIAVSVFENGKFSEPYVIIKNPYHMSYPCVFEYKNEVYMIPETSQNRTIEIYKAMDKNLLLWNKHKVLCVGNYVDTSVLVLGDEVFLISYSELPNKYTTTIFKLDMNVFSLEVLATYESIENVFRPAGRPQIIGTKCFRTVQYNANCYGEKMSVFELFPEQKDWIGIKKYEITVDSLGLSQCGHRTHTYELGLEYEIVDVLTEGKSILAPFYKARRKLHNLKYKFLFWSK